MNSFFLSFISRFYGRDISSGWMPCIFTLLDPDFLPPFPFFAPPLPPFLGGMIVSESSLASLLECPMTNCANNLYTMSWIKHSSNIPSLRLLGTRPTCQSRSRQQLVIFYLYTPILLSLKHCPCLSLFPGGNHAT